MSTGCNQPSGLHEHLHSIRNATLILSLWLHVISTRLPIFILTRQSFTLFTATKRLSTKHNSTSCSTQSSVQLNGMNIEFSNFHPDIIWDFFFPSIIHLLPASLTEYSTTLSWLYLPITLSFIWFHLLPTNLCQLSFNSIYYLISSQLFQCSPGKFT